MKPEGFSLIELLVVIGIVIILMALMAPALMILNEKADCAKCQSHLKQITTATASQWADLRDSLPSRGAWDRHGEAADQLLPYLKYVKDVFHCPSNQGHSEDRMRIPSVSPAFYIDYEFNGFLCRHGAGPSAQRRQNGITDASLAALLYDHPYTGDPSQTPPRAHPGGVNVGYLDGHVAFLHSENMGAVDVSGDDGSEFYLLGHVFTSE